MNPNRREFITLLGASTLLAGCSAAAATDEITPEAFGARGDGKTNDTDAFARLSAHVNARGGGTVVLRPVTYVVGKQVRATSGNSKFSFNPADILHFIGCSSPLVIRGNGAILRCASGLRVGTFEPATGRARADILRPDGRAMRAAPYLGMILVEQCTGSVDISDIELDGNLGRLELSGIPRGGWGPIGTGLRLVENSGPERVSRVHSHHHPQDGITINGPASRSASSTISDVVCEYNGRQGCSVTGGRNYAFQRCKFRHTGRGGLRSAPAAGVDIEAEGGKPIRNLAFSDCEISDNAGFGLVAGKGDSADATFERCTFVGTTNWSAWPQAPGFRFSNCSFVGSIVHAYGDADASRAASFADCTFTDDPRLSPTGQVFTGRAGAGPIAVLMDSANAKFIRCRFDVRHGALLPKSIREVIYSDCSMMQASPIPSKPVGTYLGSSTINGNVDLGGSVIRGTVIVNGRPLPRTA